MLRLNALAKWCRQVPLINSCQDLGSSLSSHDICFTQAADSLFFMHEGLQKELLRSARVCRGPSDVFLQAFLDEPSTEGGDMVGSEEQVEPEVLRVEPMDLQLL
ncbi:PREDICTED: mediator of RNA polymerase II transcription subunit 14 [Brassica oleracea var. oleracea]|uniref:Mediator of RNA polymerase II transcription subunit 14 n=2 Tax=Brassica TaxID=3705 RepID=A0A0D3B9P5_BRAOL|nr:PREDICTED: mediator of RNA polymerase II transcription subunit 14 [Brassica oleracea var. oleracea]KAF3548217.1 hypothetical protein DY000_02003611 [Brassica cretica]